MDKELNIVDLQELCGELGGADEDNDTEAFLTDKIKEIDLSNVDNLTLNRDKFQEGLDFVSFLAGAITGLCNIGITPNKAMDYIVDSQMTKEAMEHNIEMANIQKDTAIETAKFDFKNKFSEIA